MAVHENAVVFCRVGLVESNTLQSVLCTVLCVCVLLLCAVYFSCVFDTVRVSKIMGLVVFFQVWCLCFLF